MQNLLRAPVLKVLLPQGVAPRYFPKMNFCDTQIVQPAPLPKPFQQILVSLERSEPDLSNDAGIWWNGFGSGAG